MSKGLGDIKPTSLYNPNAASWISTVYMDCLNSKYGITEGRRPSKSPSSFPSCSIINYMKHVQGNALGYYPGELECSMEYYTRVGDVLHEVSQWFMGETGVQYGHWKCMNPKCKYGKAAQNVVAADGTIIKEGKLTRKHTTKNTCPKCKKPMFHIEVEIRWGLKKNKGHKLKDKPEDKYHFRGFVDGIWKIPKELGGGYWIIDYKTTSMKKMERNEYPERKHLYQLPVYAHILKKKYGLDVKGFSLIYVPRDNPRNFYEYREEWNKDWEKWSEKVIKENVGRQVAIDKDLKLKTYENIIKTKPCATERDFEKKMSNGFDECPMIDVCFNRQMLIKSLDRWHKICKKDPPKGVFKESIKVLKHSQYKGLGLQKKSNSGFKPKHISI